MPNRNKTVIHYLINVNQKIVNDLINSFKKNKKPVSNIETSKNLQKILDKVCR